MRALARSVSFIAVVVAALPFAACGDDDAGADKDTADTATATDTVPPDVAETTTAPEIEETADDETDVEPVCADPCKNAFGQNDKSLCPVPQSDWTCVDGCCLPVFKCRADGECAIAGFANEQCKDDRFACHCDVPTGACFTWYCGVDDDCEDGERCSAGACVPTPTTAGLSIRIVDRPAALVPGATLQLHVEAYDPADADVVVAATPTWSTSDDDVIAVDSNGLLEGGTTAGIATVTATLGDKTGTIRIENVVPDPTDTITVIVRTELTLEPVEGTYAFVNGAGITVGELPVDGVIRFDGEDGPYDLHVLGTDNDWVSWIGVAEGTTLYLPIPRASYGKVEMDEAGAIDGDASVLDGVGIVEGTPEFVNYPNEGAIELVLTSQGLSSALFDFSLSVLLGADVKRYFHPDNKLPQVDTTKPVTLPGGIIFNFLNYPAIDSFVMTLPEGEHKLWSLGGRLDINELAEYSGVIFDAVGGGDLDFTQIVGAVFPLFRGFRSGYVPTVAVTDVGSPEDVQTLAPKLAIPMGLSTSLSIPPLPQIGTIGYADGLFLIGGALTPDGFMVALGLNGGADTSDKVKNPPDGIADAIERTTDKDPFLVPLAPLHSGLQGPHTRYMVAAVAASIPAGGGDPRPSAGSATLVRAPAGETLPAAPALPPFLAFPTSAATNAYDAAARTVKLAAVTGADAQRVLFKGRRGKHWTFYNVTAGQTLAVPSMEDLERDPADDRLLADNLESVLINSIDFASGVDLTKLGRPGGVALDLLLLVVDRVSFVDIKRPLPE